MGALYSPNFLRPGGLGGAGAELAAAAPALVRRAGISDASSRGGFGRAGDGRGTERRGWERGISNASSSGGFRRVGDGSTVRPTPGEG